MKNSTFLTVYDDPETSMDLPFCHRPIADRQPAAMMMMMMRMNDAANVGKLLLCMFISQTNSPSEIEAHIAIFNRCNSML